MIRSTPMQVNRRFRLMALAVALVGLGALIWFRGINPAGSLETTRIQAVVLSANNPGRDLQTLGFSPEICRLSQQTPVKNACQIEGGALEAVTEALEGSAQSYYMFGAEERFKSDEQLYAVTFTLADGRTITLKMFDQADEADGQFYAYGGPVDRATLATGTQYFMYHNLTLGRVLGSLRSVEK
jgi:hypothetical protein